MFDRALFLKSVASALATTATPARALAAIPSPLPSSSLGSSKSSDDGLCTKNRVLPYDHPLELTLRVLDGPDFDLLKYRGNVVWLNIFATWCGPCNEEQADVVTLATKYLDRGLRVIGINYQEPDDTVRAYRKKYGIRYPIAMDGDGTLINAMDRDKLGNQDFPAHLLIDRDGYLSCYMVGSLDVSDIETEFLTLLGSTPSPTLKSG